jgi:hypothetical protein
MWTFGAGSESPQQSWIDTDAGLSLSYSGVSFVFWPDLRPQIFCSALRSDVPSRPGSGPTKAHRRHRSSKRCDKTIASIWFHLIE